MALVKPPLLRGHPFQFGPDLVRRGDAALRSFRRGRQAGGDGGVLRRFAQGCPVQPEGQEDAGEGVAGPGGVHHVDRQRRNEDQGAIVLRKHHGAQLAHRHDDIGARTDGVEPGFQVVDHRRDRRAQGEDVAQRHVVDEDEVDRPDQAGEGFGRPGTGRQAGRVQADLPARVMEPPDGPQHPFVVIAFDMQAAGTAFGRHGEMGRQVDLAQLERFVDDGAAAVGLDDDDAARQPVVEGPADRERVDPALRQFRQCPVAVGVLADRRRQFHVEREPRADAGGRHSDIGGGAAQCLSIWSAVIRSSRWGRTPTRQT